MDQAMPWWLRWFLLLGTGQALLIGVTGLLTPEEIQIPAPMSPLNARFVAALYVGAAVGVALSAQMRTRSAARPLAVGFAVAVSLILMVTVLRWSEFTADGLRHRETWLVTYIVDPILALLVVPAAYRGTSWAARHHRLTPLFTVEAALLGGLGLLLLVAPQAGAVIWPWALPAVLAQLYACFFLALAVAALLTARAARPAAIRIFTICSLALIVSVLLVSSLHLPRFKPGPETWVWFGVLVLGAGAFALALFQRDPAPLLGPDAAALPE